MFADTSRNNLQQDHDDRHSSQGKAHTRRTPCRHGDSCFTADCPYKHSSEWRACKNGAQCDDFDCSANHPRNRKNKCVHGSACRKPGCSYLHPNTNKSKSSYDNDGRNYTNQAHNSSDLYLQSDEDELNEVGEDESISRSLGSIQI